MQNGDFRKEQNDEAFDIVCENLEHVVEMMENYEEEEGFPTFAEITDFLIEEGFITKKEIRRLRKKLEMAKQPELKATMSSPPQTLKEEKRDESPKGQKKTKSNSFSTVGSPSKPI